MTFTVSVNSGMSSQVYSLGSQGPNGEPPPWVHTYYKRAMCVFGCVCICIYIYIYIYIYMVGCKDPTESIHCECIHDVRMCMYVCMYVCVYIYIYIYTCACTCARMHVHNIHACICDTEPSRNYWHTRIHTYIHTYMYTCVRMHAYIFTCIQMAHIYTHTYIQRCYLS